MKLLAICGSLRKNSSNMGMLRYAQKNAPADVEITIADLSDIPFYNSDTEKKPQSVDNLMAQMHEADGFLLACPEYNYSLAPALKNALDWGSRENENAALAGKCVAILGAGGGMGTSRAQYHLRQVCVFLDLHVLNKPEVFCNAFAGTFDEQANLIHESTQQSIVNQLTKLKGFALKFS